MLRLFVIFLISAAAAAAIPVAYQSDPDAFRAFFFGTGAGQETAGADAPTVIRSVGVEPQPPSLLGRKVRIDADQRGHFVADFKLNGRRVTAMVDTGATLVAINASTARRIGLPIGAADFVHEVSTANGSTRAAVATIRELQVGKVVVNDVEAVVLQDNALSATLIGMSFLKRLSKYTVQDGALLLVQ